jgi:DNA-binding response OmpR family regulator
MRESMGTILIVDDDPAILRTVGDWLRFEGYKVIGVDSAEKALKSIEETPPDLILLDIAMPGTSGLSFLIDISSETGRPKYPVLVLTARTNMESFFATTAVDGFLAKTADPDALLKEVERIIGQHREDRTAGRGGKWRILLAESDMVLSASLESFFQSAGFEISCVADGYEAVQRTVADRPDVLILRFILPSMNGPTVASRLAGLKETRSIPIILFDDSGLHKGAKDLPNVVAFIPSRSPGALLTAVRAIREKAGAG